MDIEKKFGSNAVLRSVSGEFSASKSTIILGGSGTGKSVLIKIICSLLEQDSGKVAIDSQDMSKVSQITKDEIMDNIGFLFQSGALFDSLSVFENIAFKLINKKKMDKSKARDIAAEKLEMVGLKSHVLDLKPHELSGGMQKRVSLARTIASNPKVIFFDEPTTGLDPVMSEVINDLILKCGKTLGSTNVIVTHDMKSAAKLGDKIIFLYKGQVIWSGSRDNLFSSNNQYLDQFVNGKTTGPIVFN
ncbi:ABC transporter ATP-binding protein [Candidatus Deianiraea vastatrix]|uniref:ABC transporter ATP-binding protein n=1 Tax=Candidatus Deianiraea vastatrix TaxID=2163644 RepID=A0A5B8XDW7_9RICK|nr:ATP-binding cassette domain-containing protein [Candidatus Deianiraea vastatrix]QED23539.1 Putative ABC transporter ATP-binding protein [Candidatus Deianiraea vastatrix]